jgi:hypothetical protein
MILTSHHYESTAYGVAGILLSVRFTTLAWNPEKPERASPGT